jgi:arylformamidase
MRIIDLTQTLKAGIRGFSAEPAKSIEKDGWNARTLHIYSHAGTHVDAQPHFDAGKKGIDMVTVDSFVAECWVIDLMGIQPKSFIGVSHLGDVVEKIKPGEGLLLKTNWSKYLSQPEIYRDALPRLSENLVTWCIGAGVKLIGVEPPSVADVNNLEELTHIHQMLLKAGITIVEGLVNLDQIKREKVQFFALPLKIENGDGAPCRAIAIEK